MGHEILVFWRCPDGTRCVVGRDDESRGWQLRVLRGDQLLLAESFTDAHALFARAQHLRATYKSSAA
jgi:hypothetical protein